MEIKIDSSGVSSINGAGQMVTLTRHVVQVVDALAVTPLIVAWQAFAPMQNNIVTWTDQFYCFATTTPPVMNALIAMGTQSLMQVGFVYEFAQGQFTKQQQSPNADSYIVSNGTSQGSYAFGLAQYATVNNVSTLTPFCVVKVLYNEAAYFNPSPIIGVFLSSARAAGVLLPPPSNALDVAVKSGGGNDPVIGFNDQTNTFYIQSQEYQS